MKQLTVIALLALVSCKKTTTQPVAPTQTVQTVPPTQYTITVYAKTYGGLGQLKVNWSGADSTCLLYTSPSPRDRQKYRMPSSA